MISILSKITQFYIDQKPFVAYRKPNKNTISGFFMKDDSLQYTTNFDESGFVFAPFNSKEKTVLFPLKNAEFIKETITESEFKNEDKTFLEDYNAQKNHIKIVLKAIDEINKTSLEKVVISRKEKVAIPDFNLIELYQKLLQNYKNAFVYVWFHPKVGLWLGATPETLLQTENSTFKTMSLAGTQINKNTEKVVWGSKELEEQQMVTDFIKDKLKPIAENLKIDKTETAKAGNLLHLKTKVAGNLATASTLKMLVRALHPTPAVCGLPREASKQFILANENYHRGFYTGFLGEINIENAALNTQKSSLFVNLRCMEIENKIASLYIGGGITKDSDAENEWEETVNKSKTMKLVL